jgi:hypothetical protein
MEYLQVLVINKRKKKKKKKESENMNYKEYKAKLLSRVNKNSSPEQKRLYNKELNYAADAAMASTYKRNKLEIDDVVQYRKNATKSNVDAGYKAPKWSWVETQRLKILRAVNRSKRSYARRNKKR